MDKTIANLKEQLKALGKRYPDRGSFEALNAYLRLHLQIARVAKESETAISIEHYKLAEECQGSIGTYATGSGEGLASMLALYDIMAERAELEEQLAYDSSQLANKIEHLQEALDIWKRIHRDPNLGELLPQKDVQPLEQQLTAWRCS